MAQMPLADEVSGVSPLLEILSCGGEVSGQVAHLSWDNGPILSVQKQHRDRKVWGGGGASQ